MNRNRRLWTWTIGILIALVILAVAFWLDPVVRDWVIQHRDPSVRTFMSYVSRLGDWEGHIAVGLALLGVAGWRRDRKWMRIFAAMIVALALAGVAARAGKIAIGRARPSVKTEQVWNGPSWSSKYHAFPSGHVASSTAFFAVLFLANWRIGIACFPVPLLIGFSRIYLEAHYFSDVTFAAILGLLIAVLVARLFKIPRPRR